MYKILVVDDSALMRRIICDIINADSDFHVVDVSADGEDAYNKIKNQSFDIIVLDMVLPKMTGLELLERLTKEKIPFNVMLVSSILKEDADSTIRAIELGALDFVVKPVRSTGETREIFARDLMNSMRNCTKMSSFKTIASKNNSTSAVDSISGTRASASQKTQDARAILDSIKNGQKPPRTTQPGTSTRPEPRQTTRPEPRAASSSNVNSASDDIPPAAPRMGSSKSGRRIIALACSTGGPQALHTFIPMLPANLTCPLVLVQHMPQGFTASLASRLNQISSIKVKEAEDGEFFKPGCVYITPGGKHMEICENGSHEAYCHLSDEPPVNSLKPCADVMYRSLTKCSFDEILCVVLTGMGADGSEGIRYLNNYKKTYVISQEASTCVVYGMPKAVEQGGLSNEVVPLKSVANSIVKKLGG